MVLPKMPLNCCNPLQHKGFAPLPCSVGRVTSFNCHPHSATPLVTLKSVAAQGVWSSVPLVTLFPYMEGGAYIHQAKGLKTPLSAPMREGKEGVLKK